MAYVCGVCRSPGFERGDTVRLSAIEMAESPASIARYKILSELGRGAMARVYLALDPNIHRKVALKVLEPGAW